MIFLRVLVETLDHHFMQMMGLYGKGGRGERGHIKKRT